MKLNNRKHLIDKNKKSCMKEERGTSQIVAFQRLKVHFSAPLRLYLARQVRSYFKATIWDVSEESYKMVNM